MANHHRGAAPLATQPLTSADAAPAAGGSQPARNPSFNTSAVLPVTPRGWLKATASLRAPQDSPSQVGHQRRPAMKTLRTLVASGILLLAACAPSPTPQPTPTPTFVPAPTETTPPPTATPTPSPTPEPSATPDPLIFRDEFEGQLDETWQWVREDARFWSLTHNPGWLEITLRPGSVADGNIKNLLLSPATQGNFELQTTIRFKPTSNIQSAGLLIYESADKFIQLIRAYCSYPQCAKDGFYLDLVTAGQFSPENFARSAPDTDAVSLRLRREGRTFTGYYSVDGKQWKMVGSHSTDLTPVFVGLVAGQVIGFTPKPAQFDYFLVNRLP